MSRWSTGRSLLYTSRHIATNLNWPRILAPALLEFRHVAHRTMISWSNCRPLNKSSAPAADVTPAIIRRSISLHQSQFSKVATHPNAQRERFPHIHAGRLNAQPLPRAQPFLEDGSSEKRGRQPTTLGRNSSRSAAQHALEPHSRANHSRILAVVRGELQPSGNLLGTGMEIAGVPKAVHGAFILGSPVDAKPGGAFPVAVGTKITGVRTQRIGLCFQSGRSFRYGTPPVADVTLLRGIFHLLILWADEFSVGTAGQASLQPISQ
jgi:hypothetical protein